MRSGIGRGVSRGGPTVDPVRVGVVTAVGVELEVRVALGEQIGQDRTGVDDAGRPVGRTGQRSAVRGTDLADRPDVGVTRPAHCG